MKRPRIGVTLDLDSTSSRYELHRAYLDAVLSAGGLPIPLPYAGSSAVAAYLSILHGIVLTGGAFDVPPERYGETRRPSCGPVKEERTEFEWALCEAALDGRIPLLGICGGMQLMNVVRGGTLWQDLREDVGAAGHDSPGGGKSPHHRVEVVGGSLLAQLVGEGVLEVGSTHHQAVREPGSGVLVCARAADGVIEAIELPDVPFALGVQWHPERSAAADPRHAAIFRGLVGAARDLRR